MATSPVQIFSLTPGEAYWPEQLQTRLNTAAPSRLWAIGNPEALGKHKVGLFCSVRCPGNAIIAAHDASRKLRDEGVTVVSGFHSPVEKECLRILLRGKQPIIICLARSPAKIRIRSDWRPALESGRFLVLSPFEKRPRRLDSRSARRRNELVAALSDEVLIIHATPGGQVAHVLESIATWRIPQRRFTERGPADG